MSRASEIEKDHRRQKIPVYEEFFDFLFGLFFASDTGRTPPSEDAMKEFFANFTKKITLWGSPELLKAWIEVRKVSLEQSGGTATEEMIVVMEEFLLAIRADVGHSNKGLKKRDILRTFINDIDEHMSRR